jgi:hypothetical protein
VSVTVKARTFERAEKAATATFSGAAHHVSCRVPIPAAASQ